MQRSWQQSVDRAILICAGFLATMQFLATTGALLGSGGQSRAALVALMGSQAAFAGCCAVGVRLRSPARLIGPALVTASVGLGAAALAVAGGDLPEFAEHTLPTNAIQTLQLVAIGFLARPALAAGLVVATGPLALLSLRPSGLSTWTAIDEWILPAASSIAIIVTVGALRAGATYADALIDRNRRESDEAAAAANADLAVDEARRVIHDEVITALRAIELDVPEPARDRSCRDALDALSHAHPATPGSMVLAASEVATTVPVSVRDEGWPTTPPPPRVVEALGGAVSEALRNVERHSGATHVELVLDGTPDQVSVEIRDDGSGFAAGRHPGFGIRESIVGRIATVGGAATIASSPTGTTVRLVWPQPEAQTVDDPTPPPLHDRGRAYLLVGIAPAVANLVVAVRHPGGHPGLALLIWLAVTTTLFTVARRLAGGAPRPWFLALTTVTTLCVVVAGLAVSGPGALMSLDSWVVGYSAIVLTLLAFEAPAPWAASALLANLLVVAGWAVHDPTLRPGEAVGALVTVILVVGTGIVLGVALRRSSRTIAQAEAVRAAQEEDRVWRAERRRAHEVHLAHLDADVVPFLDAVLAGAAHDPGRTAAVLSAQCRDQLYLTQPLPEHTRAAARTARQRGVTLAIRTPAGYGQVPDAGWHALDIVLAAADHDHVVTVVPSRGAGTDLRIVVVPPVDLGSLPGAEVSTSTAQTVVTVSTDQWTATVATDPVGLPS